MIALSAIFPHDSFHEPKEVIENAVLKAEQQARYLQRATTTYPNGSIVAVGGVE